MHYSNAEIMMDIFDESSIFLHPDDEQVELAFLERSNGSMFLGRETDEVILDQRPFDCGFGCGDGYIGGNGELLV